MEFNCGKVIRVHGWKGDAPLKYRVIAFLYGCTAFYEAELLYPNEWSDAIITIRPIFGRRKILGRYIFTDDGPATLKDGKLIRTAQFAFPLPF